MKIYVEGGGDSKTLRTACRAGFSEFLKKTGLAGKMPKPVACGSRQNAYDSFCTALKSGEKALLLVDSESPVADEYQRETPEKWKPWQHLKNREGDKWDKPEQAEDKDCHLMVQCMETWFLADRECLKSFFGQGFHSKSLPAKENLTESIAKEQISQALAKASNKCKTKSPYGKAEHSFKILALISPEQVMAASPWAKRFIDIIKEKSS